MTLLDARPGGLNLKFRPGDPLTVVLTWPTGTLAGRTFTSTLGAASLGLSIVGDVMTITATPAQTTAAASVSTWKLVDTTPADDITQLTGQWAALDGAAIRHDTTVTVASDTVDVTVSLQGLSSVGALTVAGDLTLGEDLTLPQATFSSGLVNKGVIRRTHSVQVPWAYTQTEDPAEGPDASFGTAFHVDAQVTLNYQGAQFVGPRFSTGHFGPRGIYNLEGLVRYNFNTSVFGLTPLGYVDTMATANNAGSNRNLTPAWSFLSARQLIADAGTITLISNDANAGGAAFADHVLWSTVDSGAISGGANGITSFHSQPLVQGNITLHHRIGLDLEPLQAIASNAGLPYPFENVGIVDSNSVTVTEEVGVRVQAFTLAQTAIGIDVAQHACTTNIGIRNASTEVATPSVQTLSAAGNTITANAKVKRLDNTSGGALTLTSTPTIADGVDGQILILFNGSANNVVLQHGTTFNLDLIGDVNKTLAQGQGITLMWSSTTSNWIQL